MGLHPAFSPILVDPLKLTYCIYRFIMTHSTLYTYTISDPMGIWCFGKSRINVVEVQCPTHPLKKLYQKNKNEKSRYDRPRTPSCSESQSRTLSQILHFVLLAAPLCVYLLCFLLMAPPLSLSSAQAFPELVVITGLLALL